MRHRFNALVLAILASGAAADAFGQGRPAPDLARATIEDLMNITVTSASRKEERVSDVAAAVYVITQDDIRRSGFTTIPDVLRLAPGVQVAQINANKWAVSVRGFNGLFSNKLLVLVDGRSVYNRLFSGVWWDAEDLVLEDIDRIEVIRGPGAAIWGANAVNGVINILTRSAADTKGALVRVGAGTAEPGQVTVRYGGAFGKTAYRVYAQGVALGESLLAPGLGAGDSWRHSTVGFRGDWAGDARTFTLEGSVTRADANAFWVNFDPAPTPNRQGAVNLSSKMNGGVLLGRWTRTRPAGGALQIQSVLEGAHRDEPAGDYHRRTAGVDLQYHTAMGARHDLVAGAGYRVTHEEMVGRTGYRLTPERSTNALVNVFAQDEIEMADDRVHATLGARVEHDGLGGWALQPTARLTWAVVPKHQHVWVAASRALRTPSLAERGIRVDYPPDLSQGPLPVQVTLFGAPDQRSESLADLESGYRLDLGSSATIAVTGFYGRYRHLQTAELSDPLVVVGPTGPYVLAPLTFANLLNARTKGLEIDGHWTPVRVWRLDASYTAFRLTPHLDPASRDATAGMFDGDAPRRQAQLHSGVSLGRRADADVALYRVGAIAHQTALGNRPVPAYSRVDARLQVSLTPRLTAAFVGQNLFEASHAEFADIGATVVQTLVRRSARVQLTWRY